jgi:hypothetical protein
MKTKVRDCQREGGVKKLDKEGEIEKKQKERGAKERTN